MAVKTKKRVDTDFIEPTKVKIPEPQRIAVSKKGMVATAHFRATEAGVKTLVKGGNAIDAAIATAACLTVVEPTSN